VALVFSLFVLIPPVKVEVPVPVTESVVDVALVEVELVAITPVAFMLVIVALVPVIVPALKVVEVALVIVALVPRREGLSSCSCLSGGKVDEVLG
jgi:hypothetical protein